MRGVGWLLVPDTTVTNYSSPMNIPVNAREFQPMGRCGPKMTTLGVVCDQCNPFSIPVHEPWMAMGLLRPWMQRSLATLRLFGACASSQVRSKSIPCKFQFASVWSSFLSLVLPSWQSCMREPYLIFSTCCVRIGIPLGLECSRSALHRVYRTVYREGWCGDEWLDGWMHGCVGLRVDGWTHS